MARRLFCEDFEGWGLMSRLEDQAVILLLVVPYPVVIVLGIWVTILSHRVKRLERTLRDEKQYWILR
jgi:hypothetical protein